MHPKSPTLAPVPSRSWRVGGASTPRRRLRRRPRLHPQIHASNKGGGMAQRRSPRLHPQIQPSEQGAGVACRSGTSTEAAASLPDDDDMLREILLRLPPQPSSLPRAAAVCKRWRGLVTDPKFHRQFFAHHRKPPLLGFFERRRNDQWLVVTSVLSPPDRIPPQRFDLGSCSSFNLLDCRHGLVLVQDTNGKKVVVCDLITRVQRRRLAIPLELRKGTLQGAVLCPASADHVHGSCPFKVVLVSVQLDGQPLSCVYTSETGRWGNLISPEAPCRVSYKPVVLVCNCLYWMSLVDGILQFDLDENSLHVIAGPPATNNNRYIDYANSQIIEAEDGAVGFAILLHHHFQLWQRKISAHGVATWVLWKTIEMHAIAGLPPQMALLLWYDEDTDVIFLNVGGDAYEIQLKLMQSRKLHETHNVSYYLPVKSFYTPGTTIAGEFNGAEMLRNAYDDYLVSCANVLK